MIDYRILHVLRFIKCITQSYVYACACNYKKNFKNIAMVDTKHRLSLWRNIGICVYTYWYTYIYT